MAAWQWTARCRWNALVAHWVRAERPPAAGPHTHNVRAELPPAEELRTGVETAVALRRHAAEQARTALSALQAKASREELASFLAGVGGGGHTPIVVVARHDCSMNVVFAHP